MVTGNKKTSTTKTKAKVGKLKLNKETIQGLSASEQKKINRLEREMLSDFVLVVADADDLI